MSAPPARFGPLAGAYRAFRPAWPEAVFARVLARTPRPWARALDLGAGTGLVALRLARDFARVTALEPDAGMLAQLPPDERVERLPARAEDAELPRAGFALVTAGNAFHWMDGPAVLARARDWLVPGGALALFRYDPPHAAAGPLRALLAREYDDVWREHVHPRLRDPDYARRTLAASGFGRTLEVQRIPNDLPLGREELLGFLRSTSYGGGYARALPDPERYWRELDARILATAGPGPHVLDFHVELCLATNA